MNKIRQSLTGFAFGLAVFAVSSCAYDPYYSSSSYSSYGDGYGYGNSNFTTTSFISTGNSQWGYDPSAGAYYDYNRRAYYDPHLYGYYPIGYRPRYVTGAPHPRGWNRGSGYCPPPSRIRSYNLTNYRERGVRYQGLGRDWSSNVRIGNHQSRNYSNNLQRSSIDRRSDNNRFDRSRSFSRDQRRDFDSNRSDQQRRNFQRGGPDRRDQNSDTMRRRDFESRSRNGRDVDRSAFDQNRSINARGNGSQVNPNPRMRGERNRDQRSGSRNDS